MKKILLLSLLFTSSFSGWNSVQDTPAQIAGKVVVTATISTFTGGVLLAAQRVCRWSEVLDTPYSFLAIAAALLYGQHKIVEETVGEEYKIPSLYTSIAVMLGMAGYLIYQGK